METHTRYASVDEAFARKCEHYYMFHELHKVLAMLRSMVDKREDALWDKCYAVLHDASPGAHGPAPGPSRVAFLRDLTAKLSSILHPT